MSFLFCCSFGNVATRIPMCLRIRFYCNISNVPTLLTEYSYFLANRITYLRLTDPLGAMCRIGHVQESALSAALCAASAHDFHPNASCSFSTIRRHVSFGLPINLFPTVVQFITTAVICILKPKDMANKTPSSSLDDES